MLIIDACNECKYGNFLFNCERERITQGLHLRTESLWSYVKENKEMFIEVAFRPNHSILRATDSPQKLQLWSDFYLR
jgi:hypothetical protein